jgi:hypothetical protein
MRATDSPSCDVNAEGALAYWTLLGLTMQQMQKVSCHAGH